MILKRCILIGMSEITTSTSIATAKPNGFASHRLSRAVMPKYGLGGKCDRLLWHRVAQADCSKDAPGLRAAPAQITVPRGLRGLRYSGYTGCQAEPAMVAKW